MRVIGYIEHPDLKISVFKMDNRLSVKFENAWYEQTYKFGSDDRVSTLESVQNIVNEGFINEVLAQMQHMHRVRLEALARAFPVATEEPFEEII